MSKSSTTHAIPCSPVQLILKNVRNFHRQTPGTGLELGLSSHCGLFVQLALHGESPENESLVLQGSHLLLMQAVSQLRTRSLESDSNAQEHRHLDWGVAL
ncbi:hypothetical protein AAFF_G00285830 [Aldrovandia affinis]|uniref:Uncharacterized protein n=1 Tax=Aldrovandia affinis TaxID=143900 RepID=A0AAD7X169_9TELE|nr:hypothetical protein AAFF_G00285830 [Aldrovandia affinis]